MYVVSVI